MKAPENAVSEMSSDEMVDLPMVVITIRCLSAIPEEVESLLTEIADEEEKLLS